jgi:transglycosylase-like protein
VRALALGLIAGLSFTASATAGSSGPTAAWLAEARCVHSHEGPWDANTGNGYFGGMQFSARTWKLVGGPTVRAFAHPGNPAFPFAVSAQEQLRRAWFLWLHDGGSWRSWGAVGAACARTSATH